MNNNDIVNKLSSDITNYLNNKGISYITSDELHLKKNPSQNIGMDIQYSGECDNYIKMERIHINTPVKCIADLLKICETYDIAENVIYNIDMVALRKIYPHLRALNEMIGMTAIKQTIVDQILYFIQNLHLIHINDTSDIDKSLPAVHVTEFKKRPVHATTATATSETTAKTKSPESEQDPKTATPVFTFGTSGKNGLGFGNMIGPDAGLFSIFIPEIKKEKPQEKETTNKQKHPEKELNPNANVFKFPLFKPTNLFTSSMGVGGLQLPMLSSSSKKKSNDVSGDYMHTVLYGPPGTGKTEVAKILGNIFCNLGVLKSNTFKKVTRSDLVAGYLGQTAIKTREVIESAIGGVLFIDEAYALGNTEKRDSFSKECIDTLCEALSDHKHELMVIIAGYEKELNDCFFSYNEGLSSRFTWRYKIESYDAVELRKIFEKIVRDNKWIFNERDTVKDEWFKSRCHYFKYFGRDIEIFFTKTKIAHGRRVFYMSENDRRILTIRDLDEGFELFTSTDDVKMRGHALSGPAATMYL
jgi:chromosomal replication initiation ATPase DnaA